MKEVRKQEVTVRIREEDETSNDTNMQGHKNGVYMLELPYRICKQIRNWAREKKQTGKQRNTFKNQNKKNKRAGEQIFDFATNPLHLP